MKTFFSADYHLGHSNIIIYEKRPFIKSGDLKSNGRWVSKEIAEKRCQEMNKVIIQKHNAKVTKDDTVYFLGDFLFKNSRNGKEGEGLINKAEHYQKQLNGNIIFVKGNHDSHNSLKTNLIRGVLHMGGILINMIHDPKHANPKYVLNLCGHVHSSFLFKSFDAYWESMKVALEHTKKENVKKKIQTFFKKYPRKCAYYKNSLILNVGCDLNKLSPYSFDEIMKIYHLWKKGIK